jgi:hypothetical protein
MLSFALVIALAFAFASAFIAPARAAGIPGTYDPGDIAVIIGRFVRGQEQ